MKRFFPIFVLILLLPILIFSQNPTPTPDDSEDIVKISTNLIQLDVTVTDKKGNPIKDLKSDEVEIYENGVKQNISNFNFISSVREKTINESTDLKIPDLPTKVRPEQIRRTIALVVDDLTLSFRSSFFVKVALKKYVDEQMQDGDLVAIIRTGAGIGALQQFTNDKRMLYAAIEKVRWNPVGGGEISTFAPIEAANTVESRDNVMNENYEHGENDLDTSVTGNVNEFRESIFATGTLGAINYVVRGMKELPGRKSVMLFSDGFSLITRGKEGSIQGVAQYSRVLDSLRRLVDAANRASVVIYTLDARGLVAPGFTAQDDTGGRTAVQIEAELTSRQYKLVDTQEGLRYLASQTGGLSTINNNDINKGIRRMLDDQSYYLIGYQPDDELFDPQKRRFNKIEIKVKRKDLNVRYRSGFFGISDEEIAASPKNNLTPDQKIMNALTSPFASNGVQLHLNAVFGNDQKQGSFIRSFLHIDADNIKFTDLPDGKKQAIIDVLAAAFGDNGVPIDNVSKRFMAKVDEKTYKLIQEKGFIYDFVFPIKKSGAYQLRVAVLDTASEKVGSANQFVEVADVDKEDLMMSGIIVNNLKYKDWQNIVNGKAPEKPADPISDTAMRQFKAGTVLSYGAVVYNPKVSNDGKPDLTTQIRLVKDGRVVYLGKIQPVPKGNMLDEQRVSANGSMSLGTDLKAGDYILQVLVTDNLANKKRQTVSQFVPFEIVQ